MPEVTKHDPGMFCWSELATSDTAGAKKFYTGLFGWTIKDMDIGPGGPYTILQLRGKDVGALYPMMPEQKSSGMPPNWLPYVSVKNADETLKKAETQGGKKVWGPMDVMDKGRMAVLQDPTGAHFAMWQPKSHYGAQIVNEAGSMCWNELMTNNVDAAGRFYTQTFGWTTEQVGGLTGPYTLFKSGKDNAAGMMAITKEMGPMPPHWLVYFATDNCDRTASKAKELGAKIYMPPTDIPNIGRFAVCGDPQGAAFAFIQMTS